VPAGPECGDEREFVTNASFCGLLRQLAHLTVLADTVFGEVVESIKELDGRCKTVAAKIDNVHKAVIDFDPRAVPIREY
jgi:hypothetical protein